jgi:hypothetical protein
MCVVAGLSRQSFTKLDISGYGPPLSRGRQPRLQRVSNHEVRSVRDHASPDPISSQIRLLAQAKFGCAIKLIWAVQTSLQIYFAFAVGQITSRTPAVLPKRGALRNVINAGRDAVDVGGTLDESC